MILFTISQIMNIIEASIQTGISKDMIRFYEKKGLIHPSRLSNNYRDYSLHDLHLIVLIRQYNALGISLSTIGEMLESSNTKETSNQLKEQIEQLHNDAIWAYARYRNACDLQVVLENYQTGNNMDTGFRPVQYYLQRQSEHERDSSLSYVNNGIARPVFHVFTGSLSHDSYPEDSGLLFSETHPDDSNTYIEIPAHHFYRTIREVSSNTLISTTELNDIIKEMHSYGYHEKNDIFIYQLLASNNSEHTDIVCVEIVIQ